MGFGELNDHTTDPVILVCLVIISAVFLKLFTCCEPGLKTCITISPPNNPTGLYYGVSICLVSFASGLSVVTLNLHHRGLRGTEVPCFVRRVVLGGLARVMRLRFDVSQPSNRVQPINQSARHVTYTLAIRLYTLIFTFCNRCSSDYFSICFTQ